MKETKLFIQQVLSRLEGDKAGELAAKIARKAVNAVNSQIAALNSTQADKEEKVEEATEALKVAKFPIEMITDGKAYIQGIQKAEKILSDAKDELEEVNSSLKYFNDLLNSF